MSSGLSTAGAFDLRHVGWPTNPAAPAAESEHQSLLPSLVGRKVVFSGLGNTAGRQLPLPLQTILTAYWMAICHTAGAASCVIDDVACPRPGAAQHHAGARRPGPGGRLCHRAARRDRNQRTHRRVLRLASAQLLPGADAILGPIAARARAGHLLVSITGSASPDGGTAAYNDALSQRRAQSVHARPLALGVPSGQVTGKGTAGG